MSARRHGDFGTRRHGLRQRRRSGVTRPPGRSLSMPFCSIRRQAAHATQRRGRASTVLGTPPAVTGVERVRPPDATRPSRQPRADALSTGIALRLTNLGDLPAFDGAPPRSRQLPRPSPGRPTDVTTTQRRVLPRRAVLQPPRRPGVAMTRGPHRLMMYVPDTVPPGDLREYLRRRVERPGLILIVTVRSLRLSR
jgi:hypothetical protein